MTDPARFGCCCVCVKFPDVGADFDRAAKLLDERITLRLRGEPFLSCRLGNVPAPIAFGDTEEPHIHMPFLGVTVAMARDGGCSDVTIEAPPGTRVYLAGEWNGRRHRFVRWLSS